MPRRSSTTCSTARPRHSTNCRCTITSSRRSTASRTHERERAWRRRATAPSCSTTWSTMAAWGITSRTRTPTSRRRASGRSPRSMRPAASRCSAAARMAEGWACYACDLAEEIGLLSPLDRIAQQHTRVRLAARAVADLGPPHRRRHARRHGALLRVEGADAVSGRTRRSGEDLDVPRGGGDVLAGDARSHRLRDARRARDGPAFTCEALPRSNCWAIGAIPVALTARLMTRGCD